MYVNSIYRVIHQLRIFCCISQLHFLAKMSFFDILKCRSFCMRASLGGVIPHIQHPNIETSVGFWCFTNFSVAAPRRIKKACRKLHLCQHFLKKKIFFFEKFQKSVQRVPFETSDDIAHRKDHRQNQTKYANKVQNKWLFMLTLHIYGAIIH